MVMSKAEWRKKRRRQKMIRKYCALGLFAVIVILVLILIVKVITLIFRDSDNGIIKKAGDIPITQSSLLSVSRYARPGMKLDSVDEIIIHSNNTVGKTAQEQRDYYESLKLKQNEAERQSMHFIIDLDGKIYQCIPTNEIALAVPGSTFKSLSIEYCITGSDGSMSAATYESLCKLVATLCERYDLTEKNVSRHYDKNHVSCPRFFVNEDNWTQFKKDVKAVRNNKKISVTNAPVNNVIDFTETQDTSQDDSLDTEEN